jgi:multidrug efflux pump
VTPSDLAVRRPVFALVVAIILSIVGVASFFALPLRELPNVDPPQIVILTPYPGASAEVIESRISQVIERQVAGLQGIDRLFSSSRDGRSYITITFTLDRDIEDAANDVRDKVGGLLAQLPQDALSPQIFKADVDGDPIMALTIASTTMNRLELADYQDRYIVPQLATVPGVASVNQFGAQKYAMRIWLNAEALAAQGLAVEDAQNALNRQNVQLPAGTLEGEEKDYTINVARSYRTPQDFAQLPIGVGKNGYVVRMGDVARIEEGPDEVRKLFRSDGQDKVGMGIIRQSDANDLQISKAVMAKVAEINKTLPKGTTIGLAFDNSSFTQEALKEVWFTMGLALVLVAIVNLLFLGSWQAALVPTIVAPICILSTFTVLAPLGFSLNLLTLLALVLAIGLVVDDAIVVTENIQRRIDEGEPPLVAAERGARQVFFAVLATTATLISVFAPLMFLPGYIGRLFIELAVAIAAAVAFSALLALTLSPVLASKLLKPATKRGRMARAVDKAVMRVRASYRHTLDTFLGHRIAVVAVVCLVVVVGAGAFGMIKMLPQELVPQEDRGRVDLQFSGPEGMGYQPMVKVMQQAEKYLQDEIKVGAGAHYFMILPRNGQQFSSSQGGLILKPWEERKATSQEIANKFNQLTNKIPGARINANVPASLRNTGSGNQVQLAVTGAEFEQLSQYSEALIAAANRNPNIQRIFSDFEPTAPRLLVTVDRDRAGALGVNATQVGNALNIMFGPRRASTYIRRGQEYDVLMQTDTDNRRLITDMEKVQVRTATGGLVPLSNVVKIEQRGDLANRIRIDQLRAIQMNAFLAPGYTIAEAVKYFEDEIAKLPPGPVVKWNGQAKELKESGNATGWAFAFALVVVFLVLAAQFESFIHPAIIMFTVPLAAAGGLFGLVMAGSSLNLYSQVGLIILIGIAAKNGILIVEFANQLRDEGRTVRDAVMEAAELRLRPIVMTAIATAAGAFPLIVQNGPGSGSRNTIGVVIVCGALFSTLLTLFVVPVMYELLARFTRSPEWTAHQIDEYERREKEEAAARAAEQPPRGPGVHEAAE